MGPFFSDTTAFSETGLSWFGFFFFPPLTMKVWEQLETLLLN